MRSGHDFNLYMSQMGDTMEGIATKFSPDPTPKGIAEYLAVLQQLNSFNQRWSPHINESPQFPMFPDVCVYLPHQEDLNQYRDKTLEGTLNWREWGMMAVRQSNRQGWHTRKNVGIVANDHHLPTMAALSSLTEALQVLSPHKEQIEAAGLVSVSALGEQMADYVLDGAKEVQKTLLGAQDKIVAYMKAPHGEKTAAKKAYYEAHHQVKEKVADYIKRYGENRVGYLRKISFISNREKWIAKVKIGYAEFNVVDSSEFQSIVRVMKFAKGVRFGWMAIPLAAIDIPEIHHLYKTGGDWIKETIIDTAGVAGGIVGGIAGSAIVEGVSVILACTPVGWVIILVGAILAISGEIGIRKLAEHLTDEGEVWIHDLYPT